MHNQRYVDGKQAPHVLLVSPFMCYCMCQVSHLEYFEMISLIGMIFALTHGVVKVLTCIEGAISPISYHIGAKGCQPCLTVCGDQVRLSLHCRAGCFYWEVN